MDKKDIYEHLANIYLDASLKRNKKTKKHSLVFKNPLFAVIASILGFSVFLVAINLFGKNKPLSYKPLNSEIALILQNHVTKINFNFNVTKKEIYSINLNKLDLSHFKALGFSVRKANYQDDVILMVEFNAGKEKSEIYLNEIPAYKWLDYKVALSEFKNIGDWSAISNISFVVEDRNVKEKKGIVYIDNVRLLK